MLFCTVGEVGGSLQRLEVLLTEIFCNDSFGYIFIYFLGLFVKYMNVRKSICWLI